MFIFLYVILVVTVIILVVIYFKHLYKLGEDAAISEGKTKEIESKIQVIANKTEELTEVTNNINKTKEEYGPILGSLLTSLYVFEKTERNFRKKFKLKTIFSTAKLMFRRKTRNSFKTIVNLFK